MTNQQDVIKNFMAVLDTTTAKGEAALDEAISAVSNFSTYEAFRAQILSDCKAVGNADNFLRMYCGINLSNTDTGAITGLDAGGTTKTAKSIVPEDGSLIDFTGDEFTSKGLTVKLGVGDSKGSITSTRTFSDLNTNEVYLWQSFYTWWLDGGLDLIAESYGDNYGFDESSSAVTNTLWLVMSNLGVGTLAVTWGGPGYAQKCTTDLRIYINTYYYGSASGKDGDPGNGQKYLDRTLAHELTHAVMRANIDYFDYLPGFIKEGMAEITHGIDDVRTSSIKALAGSSTKLGQVLDLNINPVNVSGVSAASYAGGYIFLRYLAHQNADLNLTNTTASTSLKTFAGNDTITNKAVKVTIDSGAGNDSITNSAGNVKIDSGAGDDSITNSAGNVKIDSGAGNDSITNSASNVTINSGAGNDSITNSASNVTIDSGAGDDSITNSASNVKINSGAGDDSITNSASNVTINSGAGDNEIIGGGKQNFYIWTGGDDTIQNFSETDTLSITGSEFYRTTSGDDVLIQIDDGTVLLTGAAKLSTVNVKGNEIDDPSLETLTVTNTKSSPVTIKASIKTVDASTRTKAVKITGNALDNILTGGTGNDTLDGGKGNDSLTGSKGNDSLVGNAGNDTLSGDAGNDTLNGGAGDDSLTGGAGNDSLVGGADSDTLSGDAGNDTLNGGAGDDSLTGGAGNDIFVYVAGNDTIGDYGTGSDKISLTSAVKSFGSDGNNFILGFGDDSLTLADAASKKVSVVSGKVTNIFTDGGIFNAAGTAVTVNASTEKFTADSKVVTIDASSTSSATVTGNSKANKVSLGSENVFVWTKGGNDTLENFGSDDLLSITGAVSDAYVSGKNSVLKVGSNKITVKDSSQVAFTDSSGTKIFSGGTFTDEDGLSATLTTSTANFDASKTTFTAVTGNAKNNKLTSNATGMTLTGGKGNDTFVTSGGSNFITDYGTGSDKISLSSSLENFSVTGNNVSLALAKGSVTIQNGAGKKISLVSGGKTTANIFTNGGIFNAAGTAVTLNASATEFTADSKVVTIDAGLTSGATITGNSKANKISFGDGENVFVWTGGNDTLTNFGDDDLINVTGAISDGTVSKGNSVLTVGKNKITVKNSSEVNFTDSSGTKIFSAGIFTDEDETSVTLGSAVNTFDAADTEVTSVTGNAKANKIYAGDSSTTLDGGKGNDSLWGGDGSDTFIYTANTGTDKILSFGNDDLLEILNANGTKGSFTKAAFASNNLTLTVKGGGKIVFGGVTSASTFNINGDTYHVSDKTIVK